MISRKPFPSFTDFCVLAQRNCLVFDQLLQIPKLKVIFACMNALVNVGMEAVAESIDSDQVGSDGKD